jgi:L,D-transpeptidase ErfK/SrfK
MGRPKSPFVTLKTSIKQGADMQWGALPAIILSSCILGISAFYQLPDAAAAEFRLHDGIIGSNRTYEIKPNDSLIELARQFGLGYNEIVGANPGVDPILPEPGTEAIIPAQWIVPDIPRREGIVINISEMRLYYFPPRHPDRVFTYPIGIGDDGWETPAGTFRIIEKIVNPAWHVPKSIQRQRPGLPVLVPAGPDNPLGSHALRLSNRNVLIHGTDRPFGIGRKVSHGCIHLYPEDIPKLFKQTRIGTKVTIVYQPVKVAVVDGRVLVEVHGNPGEDLNRTVYDSIVQKGLVEKVDIEKLAVVASENIGMPMDVTW